MPLTKMEQYTLQQRIEIVKIQNKNGENYAKTVLKVKSFLGRREAPSRPAIVKLLQKFELLGQVSDDEESNSCSSCKNTSEYCFDS